jgi:threonine aldolase
MLEHDEVRLRCDRALSGHRRRTVRQSLAALAESPLADLPPDLYGEGEAIAGLEREVATLLGKPAAMFTVKGVIAQQAALRTWSDRSGCRNVALHPKSHIDLDERSAYERLHRLTGVRLGADHTPFEVGDLDAVAETLGAVTVELPLRRAGYRLPEWDALVATSEWCRSRGVPLHFDGARLWEAQPYYARPLAEIAALADSVYVSCYKGLGGLGGALLAGPDAFVAEARVWHARHCGALVTAFPFVLSASDGLRRHLPRMPNYFQRAQALSAALAGVPGAVPAPAAPQCNAFRLHLPGKVDLLKAAHLELARESRIWLFGGFAETILPDLAMTEVSIGDAAEDLSDDEVVRLVERLIEAAGSR